MKTLPLRSVPLFKSALLGAAALSVWILLSPAALAQDPDPTPVVGYAPQIKNIQGVLPYTESYTLSITSPYNQPSTASTISFAVDIISPAAIPAGVSPATAISYLSISPAQIVFTGPNQVRSVTVQLALPSGAIEGSYGFKLKTTGWAVDPAVGLSNYGADVNASVTSALQPLTPPEVAISLPANNQTFTVEVNGFPAQIPFTFSANGPGPYPSAIDSVTYSVDGASDPIALTQFNGLNTLSVTGSGTMAIATPGQHSVTVSAHNGAGTATTTNTFDIVVNAAPPTVKIDTPADGAVFTYYFGSPALSIPFQFTGRSTVSVIRSLSAKLDGEDITFVASGLNTPVAVGTTTFSLSVGGTHSLRVIARDDYGNAIDASTFIINVVTPVPTIVIDDPDQGQVFSHTTGTPALDIPFTFYTNTTQHFTISSVSAQLDGAPLTIGETTGLGTTSALSTGVMDAVPVGTHTLTAYGVSAGIPVSTSVTFSVVEVAPAVPPSVVINVPTPNSTYTLIGSSVNVPLNFTGTSNMPNGVITGLTATLDGIPVAITWPAGQKIPTATATVPVTSTGSHVFKVTATDAIGTAYACQTFSVVSATLQSLSGTVFFDVNVNGAQETGERPLGGVTVKLLNAAGQISATTTTDDSGAYSFTVAAGNYSVEPVAPAGLSLTTLSLSGRTFAVTTAPVTLPKTGYGLNFAAIRTMRSTALSQGFWKNNISKNLSKKPNGVQVSLADIQAYTTVIASGLAGTPFNGLTMNTASSIFNAKNQLQLQLLAAEYNYASGAYIGGNQTLTYAFICWGEAVLLNQNGSYNSSYQTFAAKWFEAYNTSEGGYVSGPLP